VAVDKEGWRLGKGGGYGDKEIKTFSGKFGKIPVITTVHELQIVDKVPHQEFDTKVDYIITPNRIIKCKMKLNVPLLKLKYKSGCGLAAMSMVYKYFGKEISEGKIKKEIGGLTKWGRFAVEHALMARNLGFKVTCHSYNLEHFEPADAKLSRPGLIKKN